MLRRVSRIAALFGFVFATTALSSACSEDKTPDPAPEQQPTPEPTGVKRTAPDAVYVEGLAFRDGRGRQLLFRGYNTKVNGIFDVTFPDGRTPNYTFPSFDEDGATKFEEMGLNVTRLTVNWSALEPEPKKYPAEFFDKVAAVLEMARRHHFYVLIDMHQDGYSKEIGEDGAPLWAIVPPPPKVLEGPSSDDRRLTGPVLAAGFNFFANENGPDGRPLQESFVTAVQQMTQRYVGDPVVLGYEAFNEPIVLNLTQLDDFHERFAKGIHAIDADAPVLFEPLGSRNQSDEAHVPSEPWKHGPGAYAPHIYTGQFSRPSQNGWESEDPAKLEPSMAHADIEARAWGTPMFVTEFGCNVADARGQKWFYEELQLQDRFLASSTAWAWEPGDWGIRDGSLAYRREQLRVMTRPFPRAVAGDLLAIERPAEAHLKVRYRATAKTRGLPHEVSASRWHLVDFRVLCDGVEVKHADSLGRTEFVCPAEEGEHTFEVIGTRAP